MEGAVIGQHESPSTCTNVGFWPWDDAHQNDTLPFFDFDLAESEFQTPFHASRETQATSNHKSRVAEDNDNAKTAHPDMNDPKVLELYMQLAFFQRDPLGEDLVFKKPDHALQYLIHSLARKLDLEYEYYLPLQQVRVSRPLLKSMRRDDYPISNQSTLNNTPFHDPDVLENDLFGFPSDSQLEQGSIDNEGLSNFRSHDVAPAHKTNLHSERQELNGLQTFTNISHTGRLALQPAATSHVLPTIDDAASGFIDNDIFRDGSDEPLFNPNVPPTNISSLRNGSPAPAPTSAFQQLTFISINGNPVQDHANRKAPSRNSSSVSKASKIACWRCRFARKKCQGDNNGTCDRCFRGEVDIAWQSVGCKYGRLGSHLSSLVLCPWQISRKDVQMSCRSGNEGKFSKQGLKAILSNITTGLDRPIISLHGTSTLLNRVALLETAPEIWDGCPEYHRLVELSLECFQSVLIGASEEDLPKLSHENCSPSACTINGIQLLSNILRDYLNELARVMFQKKNFRGNKSWCLPTFYSLSIQGLLRRYILSLPHIATCDITCQSLKHYLHLAVQLFPALCPGFNSLEYTGRWLIQDEEGIRNGTKYQTALGFLEQLFNVQPSVVSEEKVGVFPFHDNSAPIQDGLFPRSESHLDISCESNQQEGPEKAPCDNSPTFLGEELTMDSPGKQHIEIPALPVEDGLPNTLDLRDGLMIDATNHRDHVEEENEPIDPRTTHNTDPKPEKNYASHANNYKSLTTAFDELIQSLERLKLHPFKNTPKQPAQQKDTPRSRGRSPSLKRKSGTPSICSRSGSRFGSRAGSRAPSGISSPAAVKRPLSPFPDFFQDIPKDHDLWAVSQAAEVFEDELEGRELKKRWSWQR